MDINYCMYMLHQVTDILKIDRLVWINCEIESKFSMNLIEVSRFFLIWHRSSYTAVVFPVPGF